MQRTTTRSHFQIQRDVIYALLLRELSSRFGRSRGGFVWVLVEPIAHLLVPVVTFGFIRQRLVPGVEYPVFLVYGFLPFLLFKTVCLQIVDGVNAAQGLLSYRQVLLMDVFVARALAHAVIQAIVFTVVLAGLALLGYDVLPARPLELAGVLALTILLAFGLGVVFAALASLVPDARPVIHVIFMPLYFISGILFPVTRLPDDWVRLLSINPVLHLVELSQHVNREDMRLQHVLVLARCHRGAEHCRQGVHAGRYAHTRAFLVHDDDRLRHVAVSREQTKVDSSQQPRHSDSANAEITRAQPLMYRCQRPLPAFRYAAMPLRTFSYTVA